MVNLNIGMIEARCVGKLFYRGRGFVIQLFFLGSDQILWRNFCTCYFRCGFIQPSLSRSRMWMRISCILDWFVMELATVVILLCPFWKDCYHYQFLPFLCSALEPTLFPSLLNFPFRVRLFWKHTPMFIVGLRFYFNTVNSYLNALWISELQYYCVNYITNPAFFTGTSFFLIGVCHNVQSDSILLSLRKQGATDYKIS